MDLLFGDIPFEAQEQRRGCGAACLAMAYRALGRPAVQAEIWPAVARRNPFGSVACMTHLMARDAGERGFAAVAVQVRDRMRALAACSDAEVCAVLSIRFAPGRAEGHYVVLLDVDSRSAVVHDPMNGPRRRLSHADLLTLWGEPGTSGEAAGAVLIAVGKPDAPAGRCPVCTEDVPETVACPGCGGRIGLRPLAAVGCMSDACKGRLWDRLCCPACDLMWDGGQARTPGEPSPPAVDTVGAFAALDKFQAVLSAIPAASGHADLSRLVGELGVMRGKLTEALAADAAARAAVREARHAAMAKIAADTASARARLPPPPAPPLALTLDPDALGRALLERLAA